MIWADGAQWAHNFCVAAVLENIHHHRNRAFSYLLASPVPMDNSAELNMVRQGEYTDFSLPAGVKEFALCAAKTFASVPEFVVVGTTCRP